MTAVNDDLLFADAVLPVRDDVRTELTRAWRSLGQPGTWWTGAQRRALTAEARAARTTCELCAARKEAVTPEMHPGPHPAPDGLDEAIVDATHRVASDPGRLWEGWYDRVAGAGVQPGPFVEMIGVVFNTTLLDTFARGVGAAAPPMPPVEPGEPSREQPEVLDVTRAWVPTADPRTWSGWGGEYVRRVEAAGGTTDANIANIIRAPSLVPAELENLITTMLVTYRHPEIALAADQVQLIAVAVSAANDCFY